MPGMLSKPKHDNGVVYIPIGKGTLKAVTGDYVIYDRKWLLDHLEQEYLHLMNTKKIVDGIKENIDKDWEE